jgi:hypothetical protein
MSLFAGGGDGTHGFVLTGVTANDFSGFAVSRAGDVNGDGVVDVIVGAYRADPGGRYAVGASYVVFGRDTARMGNFPAVFPLATLLPPFGDGSRGFVVNGIDPFDYSGGAVSGVGDVNGDGVDDPRSAPVLPTAATSRECGRRLCPVRPQCGARRKFPCRDAARAPAAGCR